MTVYHAQDERAAGNDRAPPRPRRSRPASSSADPSQAGLFDHLDPPLPMTAAARAIVLQEWVTYRDDHEGWDLPGIPDLRCMPGVLVFWHADADPLSLALVEQTTNVAARLRSLSEDDDGAFLLGTSMGVYRLARIVSVLREEHPGRRRALKEKMVEALAPTINRAYRAVRT